MDVLSAVLRPPRSCTTERPLAALGLDQSRKIVLHVGACAARILEGTADNLP
jgi:hypothetical protein